ncbi:signal transduction histidine kinase [Paenibacillus cellulosilyticus]|uniref:histidine kinase n=1 Tax=Paenibacillus cellulosilyticus TaxID=375489 RepID=A0A2V2YC52_9BACL|nr:HAMP domain-containing sensor histidine kinase [Paenibacillus cellulosilyticus]PWV89408.1 signal transduction histidine kinase [Paenibacillus cellulosilyticus]QKS47301.1 HAMP domain-containing histidine kinase [Paenibacillus cellulosilyticus]
MKIKLRFSIHFILGLIAWLISMGLSIMLTVEVLLPALGLTEEMESYDLIVFLAFAVNIGLSSALFSWYFSSPIWLIITWISNLSREPAIPTNTNRIYTKKNKLKAPYRLYSEVITNIEELGVNLQQAELERAKLEELKRDWIAGISHDLKTPLTYISGYSALLLNEDYTWSSEEQRSFITEIMRKGKHMEDLIQDLSLSLQMNQNESVIPIHLEPSDVVEFIRSLLADTWNDPRLQAYDLNFHSDCDTLILSFDSKLLYRAIQNLIMNAILHNPPGTNISVHLSSENAHAATLIIKDTGVGMDQETLSHLFNKYDRGTTTNSKEFGTGLGMAIVKSLIVAHGGTISVQSKVSEGTTFFITLPKNTALNY